MAEEARVLTRGVEAQKDVSVTVGIKLEKVDG